MQCSVGEVRQFWRHNENIDIAQPITKENKTDENGEIIKTNDRRLQQQRNKE